MELAVAAIEEDGVHDWGPSSWRHLPPDDMEWDPPDYTDPVVLHEEVQELIESLERELSLDSKLAIGIGHNNPPADCLSLTLDGEEVQEFRAAISLIKNQPARPTIDISLLRAATDTIQKNIG